MRAQFGGAQRRISSLLALIVLVLVACSAAPMFGEGVPTEVCLLPGGFVRFESQRVPVETFVVEIRRRVRAAAGNVARFPAVRVLAEDGVPAARLDALLRELQSAGVRHVTLG